MRGENHAVGRGAPVVVVHVGGATRVKKATGNPARGLFIRRLPLAPLRRIENLYYLPVCLRASVPPPPSPSGPALPRTAWGATSRCPDESEAFCGRAHSSVGPQLPTPAFPPFYLGREAR